jgi:beta-glucuronidase
MIPVMTILTMMTTLQTTTIILSMPMKATMETLGADASGDSSRMGEASMTGNPKPGYVVSLFIFAVFGLFLCDCDIGSDSTDGDNAGPDDDQTDDDPTDDDSGPTDDDQIGGFQRLNLNGTWKFRIDPNAVGIAGQWQKPELDDVGWDDIEVPGTWNYHFRESDIPEDDHDYDRPAWYRLRFTAPEDVAGLVAVLHFEAVGYKARVWLNGAELGIHEGDFLPFEFQIEDALEVGGENVLAVYVETLNADSTETVPTTPGRYDYWIYSGIHRGVWIEFTRPVFVYDLFAHGEPDDNGVGVVEVEATVLNAGPWETWGTARVEVAVADEAEAATTVERSIRLGPKALTSLTIRMTVANPQLWSPDSPNLYRCRVTLSQAGDGEDADSTPWDPTGTLPPHATLTHESTSYFDVAFSQFGIRRIETQGSLILLNGQPIHFRGFNRHDEYPGMGRTMPDSVYEDDLDLMKTAGANAIRTAHYPNDPRIHDLTDEKGFLVIEEIPATSLNFREMKSERVRDLSVDYLRRMVARDRNHPSIVIWSVGNEPYLFGDSNFNAVLYAEAREMDSTRLVGYARSQADLIARDIASDVIMLNQYWGWYIGAVDDMSWFLDLAAALFPDKPILLSEFGADAIKDNRTLEDPATSAHFTEDYQTWHLARTWEIAESKDYMSGGFLWVFADFASPTREYLRSEQFPDGTVENPIPYYNLKGVVDRYRTPKNAYLTVRGMFTSLPMYDLTVDVRTVEDEPAAGAVIRIYLSDASLVGEQKANENGETVLWFIPGDEYRIEAELNGAQGAKEITLSSDSTVEVYLE